MRTRKTDGFTVAGFMAGLTAAIVSTTAPLAFAEDERQARGNQSVLQAIQRLQNSVNALQQTLNTAAKPRQYYLTKDRVYDGAAALSACAAGFHMASLWEIFNTSTLKYSTSLGFTNDDSGQGPPTLAGFGVGWIRTGGASSATGDAGIANCSGWTSNSASVDGTEVGLPSSWDDTFGLITNPWVNTTFSCDQQNRVWCVEDSK